MESAAKDNILSLSAIGRLAYICADVAHHVVGHAGACLLLGGRIASVSSIFVSCTVVGSAVDLAGPSANVLVGVISVLCIHVWRSAPTAARLFFILAAAFNLLWAGLQLLFSAATKTDDWAWAMQALHGGEPLRYGLMLLGAIFYLIVLKFISARMAPFSHPPSRCRHIVVTAWLCAGAIACATAAFDPHPAAAIMQHAIPQSLLLSIGLLWVPARAARSSAAENAAPYLPFSKSWVIVAGIACIASIAWLGPIQRWPFHPTCRMSFCPE